MQKVRQVFSTASQRMLQRVDTVKKRVTGEYLTVSDSSVISELA